MKKLLLLLFVVGGLQAMEELPEGYEKEDCLLELRQLEGAMQLLQIVTNQSCLFEKVCPHCTEPKAAYRVGRPKDQCVKCQKQFQNRELLYVLQNRALKTIRDKQRALSYDVLSSKKEGSD